MFVGCNLWLLPEKTSIVGESDSGFVVLGGGCPGSDLLGDAPKGMI